MTRTLTRSISPTLAWLVARPSLRDALAPQVDNTRCRVLLTGTAGFLAPEVARVCWQGSASDMWAAGIIFASLLEEHVPCLKHYALTVRDLYYGEGLGKELSEAVKAAARCVRLWLASLTIDSDSALAVAAAVVCALLRMDPLKRVSAEEALRLLDSHRSQVKGATKGSKSSLQSSRQNSN